MYELKGLNITFEVIESSELNFNFKKVTGIKNLFAKSLKGGKLFQVLEAQYDTVKEDFFLYVDYDGFEVNAYLSKVELLNVNQEEFTSLLKEILVPSAKPEKYICINNEEYHEVADLEDLLKVLDNISVADEITDFSISDDVDMLLTRFRDKSITDVGSIVEYLMFAIDVIDEVDESNGLDDETKVDSIINILRAFGWDKYAIKEPYYIGTDDDEEALCEYCVEHIDYIEDFIEYMNIAKYCRETGIELHRIEIANRDYNLVFSC